VDTRRRSREAAAHRYTPEVLRRPAARAAALLQAALLAPAAERGPAQGQLVPAQWAFEPQLATLR